ncbi:hypothetical protein PMAYCL1PPCAC_07808 [Pristionchus mayeri]|uniref:Uncharacterized protein n=1 Tax=Pristionchus mayeri TaxID=1317129 RepID=A0AAN4ZAL9_9BILA|nr:hypothetical protein PMAYCL1PPCAC_07808 [Pristionchus mayeri]
MASLNVSHHIFDADDKASDATVILSCLSCFAGGVLLGVSLLDIMPDAMEDFETWQVLSQVEMPDFPWMLLGSALGFFFVYFVDGLCAMVMRNRIGDIAHSGPSVPSDEGSSTHKCAMHGLDFSSESKKDELTVETGPSGVIHDERMGTTKQVSEWKLKHLSKEYISGLTLLLAISIHVTIETFALGVQPTTESFVTLFFGIALHKVIVLFSIGMRLLERYWRRRLLVFFSFLWIGTITFVAGGAGILLDDANLDEVAKSLTTACLSCFSAGTFLYITFFEVLGEETGLVIERISAIVGFAIIATPIRPPSLLSTMTTNDSDTLKWCLMGALFVVAFIMGLLPIWLLPLIKKWSEKAALLLSSISCFSGGILLGVCFVDMIPEAMSDLDDWSTLSGTKLDFPWILMGTVIGFLLVYIIDGVSTFCLRKQEESTEKANLAAAMTEQRVHRATICSMDAEHQLKIHKIKKSEKQEYISSLTLLLALCIHVIIEGFALGVQPNSESFLTLFIGIAIHKVLVIFAISMKLYEKHWNRRGKLFVAISFSTLALLTFCGGAAGILLQDADLDEVTKALTTAILSCFSSGTFLYITFFEVLGEETGHIVERLFCVVGFATITTALYFF